METDNPLNDTKSVEPPADMRRVTEKLRVVQNIAQFGVWEFRLEDKSFKWSDEACRIVGIACHRLNGALQTFLSFVHPDDRKRVHAAFKKAWLAKASLDIEHRILQQNEAPRHFHLQAQWLRDDDSPLLIGTVQDVTQIKTNQDKLQQSETLVQIASHMAAIGGWKVDLPEGRTYWSDGVADILGIEPGTSHTVEEALQFYAPEWRAQIRQAFDACARDGTPYDLEAQIITASGNRVWAREIGQAVRNASGDITHVQGAFQDITKSKRSEEALQQMSKRLTATLESITDGFYTVDHNWRFTYINKQAERLLLRPRSELLGKVLWEVFEEVVGSGFDQAYRRAAREHHEVLLEEFYAPLDIWLEARAYPSDEGLAVYLRDVSERRRADDAIRESEERFKIVAMATSDGIWDWDLKTGSLWWNEGMQNLFGFSPQEHGRNIKTWSSRLHPEDRERVLRSIQSVIEGDGEKWNDEYRFLRMDGTYAYVLDQGFCIRGPDGKAVRMIGSMVDITERKQAELERQEAEMRIRNQASLLDKAQDAIIITGIDTRISFWNKSAERLFGWTAQEALEKKTLELIIDDADAFSAAFNTALERGDWRGELRKRRKDGSTLMVEAHWTLVRDDNGNPQSILAIDTDITQRKAAEREIEHLAFFDPLTRLPNRRLLLDRLQHALATAKRGHHTGALLFIDLDNFKALNDTLGHDKGDLLLQQVARRLETCAPRKSDTVARLGGDEFVVMLEDLSSNPQEAAVQAELVGEKILAVFNQPFELDGYEHHTTPSAGVTLFDNRSNNVDELLKRADLAMYQAKGSGRNTVRFFDPEMQNVVSARVALETDLRHGLEQHQFFLNYQSQSDANGHVIGAEALVRWQHPGRGLVSPALFIPLAEETGLILPLGHWVLETACKQLALWAGRPKTSHLTMAVNVSARQFRRTDFVDQVLAVLDDTGANPKQLKLELTESLLVQNIESTITKMAALKAVGVSFALDDFGTGYSSLSYLKRLPLDQLKIDQSFVRDVLTDANDAAIARTIVALGQTLGLEVIAEGVETEDQRRFLAQQGCNAYQGFLFGLPLSAEHFNALTLH
jgi:diguanylate cyclase (GGDEF)-like protein/PAS domain S-box-containing protein